jgi:hypothetical protein
MDAGELQKNDKLPEYRQVEEFLSHLHEAVDKELGNRKFFDAKDESER